MNHPTWHLHLYAVAGHATDRDEAQTAMQLSQLADSNFPVTFEEAGVQLEKLERLYFEPDGSFVWVGQTSDQRWQLDGMLYDRGGRLHRVELKGWCPLEQWHQLLAACGIEPAHVVANVVEQHLLLDGIELQQLWEQLGG